MRVGHETEFHTPLDRAFQGVRLPTLGVLLLSLMLPPGCGRREDFDSGPPLPPPTTLPERTILPLKDALGEEYTLAIPVELYQQSLSRSTARVLPQEKEKIEEFCSQFITPNDEAVTAVAKTVTKGSSSNEIAAERLLKWVQYTIKYDYSEAQQKKDFHRFPVETLFETRGDGEDVSYLYASLCRSVGIDSILINFPDHIMVGVHGNFRGSAFRFAGRPFYVAEPTSGAKFGTTLNIGQLPGQYQNSRAYLYGPGIDAYVYGTDGNGQGWKFTIPQGSWEYYRDQSRQRGFFANEDRNSAKGFITAQDVVIREIAETITKGAKSQEEKANLLLRFTQQNIEYKFDKDHLGNIDYYQFPLETLWRGEGDCEDSSFVFASLCLAADVDTVLLTYPTHMAVGVAGKFKGTYYEVNQKQYYFTEVTGKDPTIGRMWAFEGNQKAWPTTLTDASGINRPISNIAVHNPSR